MLVIFTPGSTDIFITFLVFDVILQAVKVAWSKEYCAVPGNIHTPSTEGIGISWGWGVP